MKAFVAKYEHYVDDAAFLWLMRSVAVNQPHYRAGDIQSLEHRINARLDGLVISPDVVWPLCRQALNQQEAGEAFTASVVAFRSLEVAKIQAVIEEACHNQDTMKGVASALAWLPGHLVHSWIKKFLTSKDLNHKALAMMACSMRREDPANYLESILQREDCRAHPVLYARCLRIIGELKRYDLAGDLSKAFTHENPSVAFWAVWSAILMGNAEAMQYIHQYLFQPNSFQQKAIQLALRVLSIEQGRQCITQLTQSAGHERQVIIATAALGDPEAVPWLITQMNTPVLARLAGEAFSHITGIDLEAHQLSYQLPDLSELFDEESDEGLMVDADENLPWPIVEKIAALWQHYGSRFIAGKRYLLGQLISVASVQKILLTGTQRQRHAAALELSLLEKHTPLHNVQARVVQDG